MATHCFLEIGACVVDSECFQILNCLQDCAGKPDEAQCSFSCGMLGGNENFRKVLKCMVENGCMPKYEDDGICLAADDAALQDITDIAQLEGDWWVLKGNVTFKVSNCVQFFKIFVFKAKIADKMRSGVEVMIGTRVNMDDLLRWMMETGSIILLIAMEGIRFAPPISLLPFRF